MRAGKVKIRLALKVLFFFFGTFLHEFAHFIAALIFGKPAGFSVVPKISGDNLIFGNVKARTRFRVLSSFIAIAPLLWWVVLVLLFTHSYACSRGISHLSLPFGKGNSAISVIFFLWLLLQLLWAGRLSAQDIRTFFSGVFSPSGALLGAAAAVLLIVINRMRPGMLHLP